MQMTCAQHVPTATAYVVRPNGWKGGLPKGIEDLLTQFLSSARLRETTYNFTPMTRVPGGPDYQGKVSVVRLNGRCVVLKAQPVGTGNGSRYEYHMQIPNGVDAHAMFEVLQKAAPLFEYDPANESEPTPEKKSAAPTVVLNAATCVRPGNGAAQNTGPVTSTPGPQTPTPAAPPEEPQRLPKVSEDRDFLLLFVDALYQHFGETVPAGDGITYLRTKAGGFGAYADHTLRQVLTACTKKGLMERVFKDDDPTKRVVGYRIINKGLRPLPAATPHKAAAPAPLSPTTQTMPSEIASVVAPYTELMERLASCDAAIETTRLQLELLQRKRNVLAGELDTPAMQRAAQVHASFEQMRRDWEQLQRLLGTQT